MEDATECILGEHHRVCIIFCFDNMLFWLTTEKDVSGTEARAKMELKEQQHYLRW